MSVDNLPGPSLGLQLLAEIIKLFDIKDKKFFLQKDHFYCGFGMEIASLQVVFFGETIAGLEKISIHTNARGMMNKKPQQNGVTLIELMVVIAILGVVSAVTVPNLVGYVPNWRLKRAATDLTGNLNMARTTAIKESRDCAVAFSTGGYTITCNGRTLKSVTLGDYKSGVGFDGGPPTDFNFTSRGFAADFTDGGSKSEINLTNSRGTRRYTVSVLMSGVISLD